MHRISTHLSQKIAEEAQLLAEEKWIIDALRKLKQQRNSLQIEKLHLENLRASVLNEELKNSLSSAPSTVVATVPSTATLIQTSVAPTPQNTKSTLSSNATDNSNETSQPATSRSPVPTSADIQSIPMTPSEFDMPFSNIDDEICNTEKLNLSVTDSVFANRNMNRSDMEEDEEDLENGLEDDEDMENCLIEMNMLMQSKQ
ncbi:uncharacterized protein LOC111348820 [Spodoptera litura]|uniref:Uncharacterized protein LOC111348820 n=1 Tax=Spodoptera litura TaxID=69820 RepID=A0A9J7DR22_SPOLT|nr:uncharacterized protein LOC111348820 [Spodoptera litura]